MLPSGSCQLRGQEIRDINKTIQFLNFLVFLLYKQRAFFIFVIAPLSPPRLSESPVVITIFSRKAQSAHEAVIQSISL